MGWYGNERVKGIEDKVAVLNDAVDMHKKHIEVIASKVGGINRISDKIGHIEGQMYFMMQQLRAVADHIGVDFETIQVEDPRYAKPQPVMMGKVICKKRKAKK